MKKDIHPSEYREVAFKDVTSGEVFVLKSTVKTSETLSVDGKDLPLFIVDTSSASHPFYTGDTTSAKSAGRVERFNKRFAKASDK